MRPKIGAEQPLAGPIECEPEGRRESIRGLVSLFPVGLWLLRWVSHGRNPTSEDMIQIVVALDRGQGFASLTGPLHRMRLQMLASGELERLVVWYAR